MSNKIELIKWLKSLSVAIVLVIIIRIFFSPMNVYGDSMNPTLEDNDIVILLKNSNYERGDIVSFKTDLIISDLQINKMSLLQKMYTNYNPNMILIKRVIAVPGDSVHIENGEVYVNSVKLNEDYVGSFTSGTVNIDKIPPNEYFLIGDNRSNSVDSRSDRIGTVNTDSILGEVFFRVYPFSKIGGVD